MNTHEILEALEALSSEIVKLSTKISLLESPNTTDLAEITNLSHSLKSCSSSLLEAAQEKLIENVGYTSTPLQVGGATIEIKQGSPRKTWDHAGLAKTVSRRIFESSINLETGEITKSPEQMMNELLKYAAVSYWRVTELNGLNIDANDYCEVGEAKKSVIVRRDK